MEMSQKFSKCFLFILILFLIILCMCVVDMMPALHNYVTVDSDVFLSKPEYMEMTFDMCKLVSIELLEIKYFLLL